MNQEAISKVKKALEYKKMAVHALLPEQTVKHLEVIEEEVGAILKEFMMDTMQKDSTKKQEEKDNTSKIKKVNIG